MDRGPRELGLTRRLTVRTQQTLDGIVLRTHNVGEADRLCIVLTKERGRIAARARAVRKLGSRMGSLLLPGRRVTLDVRVDGKSVTIEAACLNGGIADLSDASSFAAAQQGIELLLLLTEDDEPLPEVFDLLFQFLHATAVDPARAMAPFQLRLFHLLGLLPSHVDDRRFAALDESDRAFVLSCARQADFGELCALSTGSEAVTTLVEAMREQHARRDLRSAAVYSSLSA